MFVVDVQEIVRTISTFRGARLLITACSGQQITAQVNSLQRTAEARNILPFPQILRPPKSHRRENILFLGKTKYFVARFLIYKAKLIIKLLKDYVFFLVRWYGLLPIIHM